MFKSGLWTKFELEMFRINQLQQENAFLVEQHMACHNALQLWMEDHKRLKKENQELK